jgi:hypothetical protein
MLRLSCPHLVQEIDEYENNGGGIEYFNSLLKDENNQQGKLLRENFKDINNSWKRIRNKAITDNDRNFLNEQLGPLNANNLINSGLIGISINRTDDVKCLHAQIADTLIRGPNCNKIGDLALKKLNENGCDTNGCEKKKCYQQCDLNFKRTDDSYYYIPQKNKQKLRQNRINRILHRNKVAENIKRKASNNTNSNNNNNNNNNNNDDEK